MKPRTLRDEIRTDLQDALATWADPLSGEGLDVIQDRSIAEHLTPVVLEIVEYREQMARIDRGILPYDED